MLDVLLALDRMLVEVSMRLYNVPRHDRLTMRKQNRHLHAAVRQHLPRLLNVLLAGLSSLRVLRTSFGSSRASLRVR